MMVTLGSIRMHLNSVTLRTTIVMVWSMNRQRLMHRRGILTTMVTLLEMPLFRQQPVTNPSIMYPMQMIVMI